jgi:hypothetical protein
MITKVPNFTPGERPGNFFIKYPKKNFTTKEPISTNSIPIDSARQAETQLRNFKNVSKFVLGQQSENFHEKIPLNKFSTV